MKKQYQAKFITVDKLGQIHTKTNFEPSAFAVAEMLNYAVKRWVPKIVIGIGRRKKIIEGHYRTIKEIYDIKQIDLFVDTIVNSILQKLK